MVSLRKGRMLVPEDVDDGGSFESLVKEAEEAAGGDEALKLRLLTERIVEEFVNRQIERAWLFTSRQEARMTPKKHCVLGVYVPTKRRSGPFNKFQLPAATTTLDAPPKLPAPTITILNPPPEVENKKSSQKRRFDQIQDQNSSKKEKQRRKRKSGKPRLEEVPDMSEIFKNKIEEMGGKDVKLVIQKELSESDLDGQQGRLTIPNRQILNMFLTEEEEKTLDKNERIDVRLIQPCLDLTKMNLKKWRMGSNFNYVLITTWHKEVVKNATNGLHVGLMVQLYSFRLQNNQLCFALVKLD